MATWTPDPTFYPSAKMAIEAPAEWLACVALLNPHGDGRPDALAVLDVAPTSASSRPGTETSCRAGARVHDNPWIARTFASISAAGVRPGTG